MSIPFWRNKQSAEDGCYVYQCLNCYNEWTAMTSPDRKDSKTGFKFCPFCATEWKGAIKQVDDETKRLRIAENLTSQLRRWAKSEGVKVTDVRAQEQFVKLVEELPDGTFKTDLQRLLAMMRVTIGTMPPGIVRPPEDRRGIEEISDFNMEVVGIRLDPKLTKEEKIKKLKKMKDTLKKECEAGTIEDVVRDIRNDEIDFIIDMLK